MRREGVHLDAIIHIAEAIILVIALAGIIWAIVVTFFG
jgi:hypothetical protein